MQKALASTCSNIIRTLADKREEKKSKQKVENGCHVIRLVYMLYAVPVSTTWYSLVFILGIFIGRSYWTTMVKIIKTEAEKIRSISYLYLCIKYGKKSFYFQHQKRKSF